MAKKKKEEQEPALARPRDAQLPAHVAAEVREDGSQAGLENMDARDLIIPRLMLMQGQSPQVQEGMARLGQVFASTTNEQVLDVDETCEFIPVYHYKEWIEWADRESGEGILDRSVDPDGELAMASARSERRTTSEGKEVFRVTEYHNFIVVLPHLGLDRLLVISCARSNHKHGRALLAMARYRAGAPLFAGKYRLGARLEQNRRGQKYMVFSFENAGWADEEQFAAVKAHYTSIRAAWQKRLLTADHGDGSDARQEAPVSDETEM